MGTLAPVGVPDAGGIFLGRNAKTGNLFSIAAANRTTHMHVIGASRRGKSNFLACCALQDLLRQRDGITYVDPHGSSVEQLLAIITEHRLYKYRAVRLLLRPADGEFSFFFNPFLALQHFDLAALSDMLTELRDLYPAHWRELSRRVRFERAGGTCQGCGRPHGATVRCLPDGRWYDPGRQTWRDRRGRLARWPDLEQMLWMRTTHVVLAAAHLDHDPANRLRNLRSLCQRCHLTHDRPHHLAARRITYLLRRASGDLFVGPYVRRRPEHS